MTVYIEFSSIPIESHTDKASAPPLEPSPTTIDIIIVFKSEKVYKQSAMDLPQRYK